MPFTWAARAALRTGLPLWYARAGEVRLEDTRVTDSKERTPGGVAAEGGLPLLPPLAALVELAVLTLLILGLAVALPEIDLVDIQPNPFWLPVLLLSLQYGTASGLLAAAVAIAAIFASGVPHEGVGESHFSYVSKIWAQPMLWIAAALLLGQFRMRQIAAKQALSREVTELGAERDLLAGHAEALRGRLERLERERAGAGDISSVRALGALADLKRAGDLAPAFRSVIEAAFPGGAASVFLARSSGLSLLAETGWPADAGWARELAMGHPLVRAVVGEGRALCVTDALADASLAGEGLAAVPIRAGNDCGVIGLLKLERAPPSALTTTTIACLEAIAAALAAGLSPTLVRSASQPVLAGSPAMPADTAELKPRRRWRLGLNAHAAPTPVPTPGADETHEPVAVVQAAALPRAR
jgi:polysaccharide biosynthesis protein PelD